MIKRLCWLSALLALLAAHGVVSTKLEETEEYKNCKSVNGLTGTARRLEDDSDAVVGSDDEGEDPEEACKVLCVACFAQLGRGVGALRASHASPHVAPRSSDMSGRSLTGTIPEEIGSFKSLEVLCALGGA